MPCSEEENIYIAKENTALEAEAEISVRMQAFDDAQEIASANCIQNFHGSSCAVALVNVALASVAIEQAITNHHNALSETDEAYENWHVCLMECMFQYGLD